METKVDEISDGIYHASTFLEAAGLVFNQFVLDAEQPLLFHTGHRALFPLVSEAVARVVPVERLRWVSFGHFEADECGSMNRWLEAAPRRGADDESIRGLVGRVRRAPRRRRSRRGRGLFAHGAFCSDRVARRHGRIWSVRHVYDSVMLYEDGTPRTKHVLGNIEVECDADGGDGAGALHLHRASGGAGTITGAGARRPLPRPLRACRRRVAIHGAHGAPRPPRRPQRSTWVVDAAEIVADPRPE